MRSEYSDEVRAAVIAALLAGQAPAEVARAYNVPAATIRSWKSRTLKPAAPIVAETARSKIGEMLLEYLAELIQSLRAQVAVHGEPAWLRRQSAEGLAVLHGVSVDKAIRLLEALERPDEDATGAIQPMQDITNEIP